MIYLTRFTDGALIGANPKFITHFAPFRSNPSFRQEFDGSTYVHFHSNQYSYLETVRETPTEIQKLIEKEQT